MSNFLNGAKVCVIAGLISTPALAGNLTAPDIIEVTEPEAVAPVSSLGGLGNGGAVALGVLALVAVAAAAGSSSGTSGTGG